MALKANKQEYTRISNGSLHSTENNNGTVHNNSNALAKLKKKLQSFENPAYDRLKEDGLDDPQTTPSRTSSKVLLDSTEDLNLRPPKNSSGTIRRQRRKKCALVICVVILVVVISIIATLASYIATRPNSDSTKAQPVNNNSTSSLIEYTTPSIPGSTVFTKVKVTSVLFGQMKVASGPHNIYKSTYSNTNSADFKKYEEVTCDSVAKVFSAQKDDIKNLYSECSLKSLRKGSVLVDFIITLANNISIDTTEPIGNIKFSVSDIIHMFTNYFTPGSRGGNIMVLPNQFIIDKKTFKMSPGQHLVHTTAGTTITSNTTPAPTTTTTVQTSTVSTVSPDVANCNKTQFMCHTGVITLQHKAGRIYCIDENERCDGYTDCLMGEDESECGTMCSNGGFRCRSEGAVDLILNSQCTWTGEECDGVGDCSDSSDELNCTCVHTDFRCVDGTDKRNRDYCIPSFYVCDKEDDCTDGSDEMNCTYTCKEDEQFMCKTGTIVRPPFHGFCIDDHEVCDGHMDCLDQSDEIGCNVTCPDSKFRCETTDIYETTYCIPNDQKCDRVVDCKNNTDERLCDYTCPTDMFQCKEGVISRWPYRGFCLYEHEKCNGVKECGDNSDEDPEVCKNVTQCSSHEFRCTNGTDKVDGDYCIPKDNLCDRRVDCTDKSDEKQCTYTCAKDYYLCTNGTVLRDGNSTVGRGFCLPGHTKCNGVVNCEDGSDERNCNETCGSNLFKCLNGTSTHTTTGHMCIPQGFQCDRDNDCSDGSDELNCNYSCSMHQWPCKDKMLARWPYWGFCIWERERCDGYFDCEDHSDEDGCEEKVCSPDQIKCTNGSNIYFESSCIPKAQKCDRYVQCLDGSDELNCNYDCSEDQFMCAVNTPGIDHCIPLTSLCNTTDECADGSDEAKCHDTCSENQFRCVGGYNRFTGSPCIDSDMKCDRFTDCTDGSDEGPDNCDYTKCKQEGMFACINGTLSESIEKGTERRGYCLPPHLRCNGVVECEDGSDEEPDMCEKLCDDNQFMCVNGTDRFSHFKCVPLSYRCDRQNDCTDGSDEGGCVYDKCTEGQWTCESSIIKRWPRQGYCIKEKERCDGVHDCLDMSDEKGCNGTNCKHERGKSFLCTNGADKVHGDACIPEHYYCDQVEDCTDGSDEHNCTYRCPDGMTACQVGLINKVPFRGFCLYPGDVCDGEKDCEDGSDESDCEVKCGNHEFKCKSKNSSKGDGSRCISAEWRCDREPDCDDGSDEEHCVYDCNDDQFQCKNGSIYRWPYYGFCIKKSDVCDGYKDCDDLSDEAPELCDPESFKCPDGKFKCSNESIQDNPDKACILEEYVCDRFNNCDDQSDEQNCTYTCNDDQFKCVTKTVVNFASNTYSDYCIQKNKKCDGSYDCVDKSDEENCGNSCSVSHKFRCFHGLDVNGTTACIPEAQRCDGIKQCHDGSDEQNCTCPEGHFKCPSKPIWYYKSSPHWCLEHIYVCDNFVDCGDYSDERDCSESCPNDHFTCGYRNNTLGPLCISKYDMLCNGENDCNSGADESNALCDKIDSTSCSGDQIPCHSGYSVNDPVNKCVPLSKRCDRIRDCSDGSDELDCSK